MNQQHCPFCKNRINRYDGRHIYRCKKNMKIWTKDGIKYEFLSYNFPVISTKNTLFDEYVVKLKSLPDIKKDYLISYKNIIFLLDYHGIKRRNMKASSKQISSKKYKKTCTVKYGVDNVSKLQSVKNKKKNRKIDPSKNIEDFKRLNQLFISKTLNLKNDEIDESVQKELKKLYVSCYKYWLNLSDEQKDFLLDKIYSSIESKITNCLDKLNITYTKRFMVGRKFFDIKIKNILIDVNSDLWHANPLIYKENDSLKFPFKNVKAKTLWQRDLNKKKLAESIGYKVFYIWENDIKDMEDEQIIKYLTENIFNI
jgi:G:T-mismatch repair DNA endonuclease (very short patch repair protein)